MIVASLLRQAAAAACLVAASSIPARAVEFGQGGRPFEALMGEGYRIVAAAPMPGLVVPMLLLGKDSSPDTFICVQQIRDCARLVDSPTNRPPGLAAPLFPQAPPR